ncbi:MAG: hypothetical protein M3066_17445 [Actinomycetota bacterium]|nr:hypothetical protein [Actinomycetota bacterium]
MRFFDRPQPDPDDASGEEDDAFGEEDDAFDGLRPAAWVGGVVPLDIVIARSAEAAVVATRMSAFPEGFELTVDSYLHRSVSRRRASRVHRHGWMDDDEPRDELLRFGIAWPDGGRATDMGGRGPSRPDAAEPTHGMDPQNGGGSDREYSQTYWVWPLPGPGQLQFVAEWPAFGVGETAAVVDAGMLIGAAAVARPIWAEDKDKASHISRATRMQSFSRRSHDVPGPLPESRD